DTHSNQSSLRGEGTQAPAAQHEQLQTRIQREYIHQPLSKGATMSTTNLQQRLNDLFGYIRQGRIIEAMNEFYDKDTVMQDNANPPTKGLAANIEREKQFMSGVKEWKGFNVTAQGVGDDVTFYECNLDFI